MHSINFEKTISKAVVFTVIATYFSMSLCAQAGEPEINDQPIVFKELKIGDTALGKIRFTNLTNYPKKTANLADFKGKLVILDFWATWCSPCVSALARLQTLQQQFGDKVQIITVTYEENKKVLNFFHTNKIGKQAVSLATEMADSVLSKILPHRYISHEVWIDGDGIVRAITTDQYVNAENIRTLLDGRKINWPVKNDFSEYDVSQPLFIKNEIDGVAFSSNYFYSGFRGNINGPSPGLYIKRDSVNQLLRYNQFNCSILTLYCIALKKFPTFNNPKRCVFNVKDISRFFYPTRNGYRDKWVKENTYCYETVLPLSFSQEQIRQKLKSDLDLFFGLEAKVVNRKIKCLILRQTTNAMSKSPTSNELPRKEFLISKDGDYMYSQRNELLTELVNILNIDPWLSELPLVIDETNASTLVDLELIIGKTPDDLKAWRKALNKYGLDLMEEIREMEILEIREKEIPLKGF